MFFREETLRADHTPVREKRAGMNTIIYRHGVEHVTLASIVAMVFCIGILMTSLSDARDNRPVVGQTYCECSCRTKMAIQSPPSQDKVGKGEDTL